MRKLTFVSAFFLLLLTTSFMQKDTTPSIGLSPGSKAPDLILNGRTDLIDLKSLRGKKVVLNFWAAYDAKSRVNNQLLWNFVKNNQNQEIKMISVCYDHSRSIFEETVRMDKLDKKTQYYDQDGALSKSFKVYRLKKGFSNYVLNEAGIIIAKNLSPKELTMLMDKQVN